MKRRTCKLTLMSLAWLLGCDPAERGDIVAAGEAEPHTEPSAMRSPSMASQPSTTAPPKQTRAIAPIVPNARQAFDEVVKIVGKHYVDGPLPDDVLWTGAVEGVMARLIQLEDQPINVLMSPDQLRELKIGTQGQLVGVGVAIEQIADIIVIREVIPDSPAASADLEAGDRILQVDGERLRGMELAEVVDRIRGDEGSAVELFVQRETEEWTVSVERGRISYSSVESKLLEDDIGYLRINAFSEATVRDVERKLEELDGEGLRALVLDLRACPGGLVETSVGVAELFLPPGRRILTVRHADGSEEHSEANQSDRWDELPLAVLVGPRTQSGAEILAIALAEHDRAPLVGMPTRGKGTVESLYELDNGWALKLTTSRWLSPSGEPRHGVPIDPDLTIPVRDEPLPRLEALEPGIDPQLAGALQLLRRR